MVELVKLNKDFIEKNMSLGEMESDTLILIADYMNIDIIKGTHIINQLYKHTLNFPKYIVNFFFYLIKSKYRLKLKHWIFHYEL